MKSLFHFFCQVDPALLSGTINPLQSAANNIMARRGILYYFIILSIAAFLSFLVGIYIIQSAVKNKDNGIDGSEWIPPPEMKKRGPVVPFDVSTLAPAPSPKPPKDGAIDSFDCVQVGTET